MGWCGRGRWNLCDLSVLCPFFHLSFFRHSFFCHLFFYSLYLLGFAWQAIRGSQKAEREDLREGTCFTRLFLPCLAVSHATGPNTLAPVTFLRPLEMERMGVNGYAAHRYNEDLPEP